MEGYDEDLRYQDYLKRRDELLNIRSSSFASFDKALLSLSTGAIALSIVFLEKIGPPFDVSTLILIHTAWGAFALTIVSNLLSYHFATKNMDLKIAELDKRYTKEREDKSPDTSPEHVFWQRKATSFCNKFALITFFAGVLLFTAYVMSIQIENYRELQATDQRGESHHAKTEEAVN